MRAAGPSPAPSPETWPWRRWYGSWPSAARAIAPIRISRMIVAVHRRHGVHSEHLGQHLWGYIVLVQYVPGRRGTVRLFSGKNGKYAELPLILTLREVVKCFGGHGAPRH